MVKIIEKFITTLRPFTTLSVHISNKPNPGGEISIKKLSILN